MNLPSALWLGSCLWLSLGATACCTENIVASGHGTDQALKYLEQHGRLDAKASPRPALMLINEQTDTLGLTHQRLQQINGTVPVWGRELIVHYNRDGVLYRVDGDLAPLGHWKMTAPRLTAAEAEVHATTAKPGWAASQAVLYVYMDGPDAPHLTYYITLTRDLLRQFVFIDAMDGHIVAELAGTMSDTSSVR